MTLLTVKNLWVQYGSLLALRDISIEVEKANVVAIIGSNGAGKTSLLKTISGLIKPAKGKIYFEGNRIDQMSCDEIVRAGIALCPEGREIFTNLTVAENLTLGAYARNDREKISKDLGNIYDLFPVLWQRRRQGAGTLSGGEQQMLAVGRALMSDPVLLLLDEPSLGLSPMVINEIGKTLEEARLNGITVILVEQNCTFALARADEAYVLEQGEIVMKGSATEIQEDKHVKQVYLGI